jgi:hypothetical protein
MCTRFSLLIKRSFWIGAIITILTPFLSTYTITESKQLSELRFGFPFRFVSQQSGLTPFEENLPLKLNFISPWENPTKIIVKNFVFSLLAIVATILLFSILVGFLRDSIEKYKRS